MIPILLLLVTAMSAYADGAKVLAFVPFPARSHQRFIQPLVRELAIRGHQVTFYYNSYLSFTNIPANLALVEVPDYTPILAKLMGIGNNTMWQKSSHGDLKEIMMAINFRSIGNHFEEWILSKKVIQDLINSDQEYDAVIVEDFLQESFIALNHRFKAPAIMFIASPNFLWSYFTHGNPFDTSYIADCMLDLTDTMDFNGRLLNTFINIWYRLVWSLHHNPKSQDLMDKYIRYPGWEERPSMSDMLSRASLVLINSHVATNYPFPYAPHLKEVGGLHILPPAPLPKDLQKVMDDAKDGVIYFSLGSLVESSAVLGAEEKQAVVKVLSGLKQTVLWKWNTEFPNLPKNIKISKWFPQQSVLSHKNCKLFITHGGMLSLTEAINYGVPTIGVPLLGDQRRNVKHMLHFGYGLPLNLKNITEDSLAWTINEILSNPRYAENARKRSQLFKDKPETALETAIYWTEYVIRHKGAHHLRPAIATMPWYQQAMIDVYVALALIILLPIFVIYKVTHSIFQCIRRLFKKESSEKEKKE